nr:hypothetical protein BaRGS_014398 [Batillaria attramentaria]
MILAYYFPDRTNIVTGVSLAGAGLGMFIHPPLFAFLDEVYGLPGAFLLTYDSQIILLPTYNIRLGGLSQIEASFASSMSGIGSVVSRVLGGVLAHDRRVGNLLVYCGLLGVEALAALVAPPLLTSGKAGT